MIDGQPRAIQLQGITHNTTKIGVQDGQSEDLVNLRFKDGAWRSTGDGKYIMDVGKYQQIFIHTNVYRHMLGVYNRKLWWFASAPEDKPDEFAPITPVEICDIADGDVSITQTGNLITVIDSNGTFYYFLYKEAASEYTHVVVDANGEQTDRDVFPFGDAHINLYSPNDDIHDEQGHVVEDISDIGYNGSDNYINAETACNRVKAAFAKATERNLFTKPFLACLAVKSYDGSYLYATPPTLIYPRQALTSGKKYSTGDSSASSPVTKISGHGLFIGRKYNDDLSVNNICLNAASFDKNLNYFVPDKMDSEYNENTVMPALCVSLCGTHGDILNPLYTYIFGSDLVVSLNTDILKQNADVFTHVSVFVSPEVDVFDLNKYTCRLNSRVHDFDSFIRNPIVFDRRDKDDISYELTHSNLYLLKEYKVESLPSGNVSFRVDLSKREDDGLLKNIVQQRTLDSEAFVRSSYLPRYTYSYNGRLHLANYKTNQFHGYPLDMFNKNNHSVKIARNATPFLGLSNLAPFNDEALQNDREQYTLASGFGGIGNIHTEGDCAAYVTTYIESNNGEQIATRYIPLNDPNKFIEDLDSFLVFPDARAKRMDIRVAVHVAGNIVVIYDNPFELTPHEYLNIAYYISPSFKPIKLPKAGLREDIINIVGECYAPDEKNMQEDYQNAIKVSSTDNPTFFPFENTYQIGSSEIVAMCSNAIAVGTGQTGDAPLYVFCKDGIYALFVDSSGQITYTNARVIARDVCNNPKSVTPIDAGVVFTTDRGLMMIAGNEVQEIGQPLEGDWCKFTREGDKDYSKHPAAAYEKVAELPADSITRDDFLTYLRAALVSYNHNERELMVSNPQYRYTYILDRYGNWSRRDYRADEYVSNYPVVYRREGRDLYQVDKDSDEDSGIFVLSNVVKMESIGFKELNRVVARGYFETISDGYFRILVQGSYDGRKWVTLGHNTKRGKFRDMGCLVERTDCRFFRFVLAGKITKQSRFDYFEVSSKNSKLGAKIR